MNTYTTLKASTGRIKQADPVRRTISFIASHELIDRDGELVKVSGIDLSTFSRNPILLMGHDWKSIAVAEVRNLRKTLVDGTPALTAEAFFPPGRPQSDEALADVQSGLLNTVSIGFRPLSQGSPELPGQRGPTFLKSELLEISLVSIPSCATCVIYQKEHTMPTCTCQQKDYEITPEQMAAIPRIAREIIHDTLAARQRWDEDLEIDEAVFRRGMQALPQIVREAVSEVIGGEVATALNRLRGRVD